MASVTPARIVALEVLTRVRHGELVDRALPSATRRLEPRDRAWVHELVYGTLRLRGRLDAMLAAFVRPGLASLDPAVLDVLRLGAYQLEEMGGVPPYAAVSQSVELARNAGAGRAAGLVNGVLQSFIRGRETVEFPAFDADPIEYLSTWGSHPGWLIERWVARWGPDETRRLVEADNRKPELYLTPVRETVAVAIDRLKEAGIEAEAVEGFPGSVRIPSPHGPEETLKTVSGVIQDPAAASVVRFAGFPEGATVLDLCAAPGGKTIGLANRAGLVVACDLSVGRLRRLRSNVERVEAEDRVTLAVADGRFPPFKPVTAVLLDAPCTGTGTLRRHVDGRWRINPRDLEALATLQAELLAAAARIILPGGILVYATCSLEAEENERQVESFLSKHPEFRLMAPDASFDGTTVDGDYLKVLPQLHRVDGAFAARLERFE